jgi:hypothetical protein
MTYSQDLSLLDDPALVIQTGAELDIYSSVADKKYSRLMQLSNVTSYSQRQILHSCPRKYQLSMWKAKENLRPLEDTVNLHFTFGHAVGSGVQSYLLAGNPEIAIFNAFMAWRAPFEARLDKKKKSLWEAVLAVESFIHWWETTDLSVEWELAYHDGKPAIELAFSLHAPNGYKDYGHIDIVLKNRITGQYAILELKTTAAGANEAQYANSSQALGYSLMLESMFGDVPDYTVLYAVFETKTGKWNLMPFDKTARDRAEWIKDLLLDHSAINTYLDIGFFPKRGESCFNFSSRCEFFGECNMVPEGQLPILEQDQEAEPVNAVILLADVIKSLKQAKARSQS